MKKLFALGLVIKIIIAAATLHDDLIFAWERPFNNSLNLYQTNTFYPPLTYFFFKILQPVYFLIQYVSVLPIKLLLLKTPYLLVDVFILWILLKTVDQKLKKNTLILWWFNPVVIYSAYAMGTFDILSASMVVLAILYSKKNTWLSPVYLSAGAAFKTIPLFLVPASILYLTKNLTSRIKFASISLLIPLLSGVLMWIVAKADVINSYIPRGIAPTKALCGLRPDALWKCSTTGAGVFLYLLLLLLLFIRRDVFKKVPHVNILFSAFAFIYISFPANSMHRYVPLIPLFVITIVKNNFSKKWLWIFSACLIFGYLYIFRLEWGLLVPIFPQTAHFKALREATAPLVNYENVAFLLRVMSDIILIITAVKSLELADILSLKSRLFSLDK